MEVVASQDHKLMLVHLANHSIKEFLMEEVMAVLMEVAMVVDMILVIKDSLDPTLERQVNHSIKALDMGADMVEVDMEFLILASVDLRQMLQLRVNHSTRLLEVMEVVME